MPQQQENNLTSAGHDGPAITGDQAKPHSDAAFAPMMPATQEAGDSTRIHIVLDKACLDKIKKACDENERTTSAQIRFLIRNHL